MDRFQGTVTETMSVEEYTYALLNVGAKFSRMAPSGSEQPLIWLAGPRTELAVGDVISWEGGAVMSNFHSNTLDRTFTEIVFVNALTRVK
jgi:hypothetical protein